MSKPMPRLQFIGKIKSFLLNFLIFYFVFSPSHSFTKIMLTNEEENKLDLPKDIIFSLNNKKFNSRSIELLLQYNEHLKNIQDKIFKSDIVQSISTLKLTNDNQTFWKLFEAAQSFEYLEIAHGLAREYINKVENPKKDFYFLLKGKVSDDVKDIIRKQYFLMKNDPDIMHYDDKTLTISFHELQISKQLQILNCKLDLSNKFLNNIEGISNLNGLDLRTIHQMEQLDLSNNYLKTLPNELSEFEYLKNLNLKNNQLEQLPENVGNLPALIKLNLSNNKLKTLPEGIGKIKTLWNLEINDNQLESLTENIATLTNLNWLFLNNNNLTRLPDILAELPALRKLHVENNKLTQLSNKFKNIPILHLQGNPLGNIEQFKYEPITLQPTVIESKQLSNDLYFCTAADERFFPFLLNLIGSIHKTNFDNLQEIAIFDLGFSQDQRNFLNTVKKTKVYDVQLTHPDLLKHFKTNDQGKTVRGWYAWKPVAIKQALDMFPYVLYLDAGTVVLKPLDNLFTHIQEKGYFLLEDQKWMLQDANHKWNWYKFTIKDHCTKYVAQNFGLLSEVNGWILNSHVLYAAVQGLTRKMYDTYVMPMYQASKDLKNFEDDGSSIYGFGMARHDQVLFSIQARKLGLNLTPTNEKTNLQCGEQLIPFYFGDHNNTGETNIFYSCKGQLQFADHVRYK